MLAMLVFHYATGDVTYRQRSFFGIYKVEIVKKGLRTNLIRGTTVHGSEWREASRQREPLLYYHRAGPVGQLFALLPPAHAVGVIGLGTGALGCYERPGQDWTFYEIDAAVVEIARNRNYFGYLGDCGADAKIVLGDERLYVNHAVNGTYDLLLIDAFSSDAIPIHLLTVDALRLYLQKTANHGIIVFHISNIHLRLWPLLAAMADEVGASARRESYSPSAEEQAAGASGSEWVVVAK